MAFRTALANPATGDPDQLGHRLEDALDGAASLLHPRTARNDRSGDASRWRCSAAWPSSPPGSPSGAMPGGR